MSINRRAAKRDGNETEIIEALKAVGAQVYPLSAKGVPDLLVAYRGNTYLLETKSKGGKLTADQQVFFEAWDGGVLAIVRSVDDALFIIGAIS